MSAIASDLYPDIRQMDLADIEQVAEIERKAYEFPWSKGIFRDCLNSGYLCRVAEMPVGVIGYAIMSLGAGECHILNLCIHPEFQNRGMGQYLLEYMIDYARRNRGRIAFLEVRESNEKAFRLYHRLGFNEIGTRENYYPAAGGMREAAIVLARILT